MTNTPTKPICSTCGSDAVKFDAWAEWDADAQRMVLAQDFDDAHCDDCGGETSVEWVPVDEVDTSPAIEDNIPNMEDEDTEHEAWCPAVAVEDGECLCGADQREA